MGGRGGAGRGGAEETLLLLVVDTGSPRYVIGTGVDSSCGKCMHKVTTSGKEALSRTALERVSSHSNTIVRVATVACTHPTPTPHPFATI